MISLSCAKSKNGKPPPPSSTGCPNAHKPSVLAWVFKSSITEFASWLSRSDSAGMTVSSMKTFIRCFRLSKSIVIAEFPSYSFSATVC